jgi:hypothetical protein
VRTAPVARTTRVVISKKAKRRHLRRIKRKR